MATLDSSSNLSSVTFLPYNESTKPEEVRVNLHYSSESMALQAKSFSELKKMDTQDGSKVLLLLFPFNLPCSFCIVFTLHILVALLCRYIFSAMPMVV